MLTPEPTDDLTDLTGEALSDALAALDATEIASKTKDISMAASARWYATVLTWPIFPIKPGGKAPLTRHGFKDASTDLDAVVSWWTRWPDANIGVPTGSADQGGCGFDVLDIDGSDGMRAWQAIKHASCPPDCSAEVFCPAPGPFDVHALAWTPGEPGKRGPGRHLYIPATGAGNAARINGRSLDYRGAGGFVVAPPSCNVNGTRYSWLTRPVA